MGGAGLVQDKVVVVTGAGGGIGRDIALAMAREGAKVVVNDLGGSVSGEGQDAGPAHKVLHEILAMGGQAAANTDSVSDAAGATRIVQTAIEHFGRIDVVVNNAGILRDRFFHKMSVDEWDAVLKVHLYGAFYVSRAAAPHFKEQEQGNFIHMIGSIPTDTPAEQARVARIKQMTPAKIAPMAVALASDAASNVNGQVFAVRNNEIFLMSQPRPVRSVHRGDGWTPQTVLDHALPALASSFFDLARSGDVFSWDPI